MTDTHEPQVPQPPGNPAAPMVPQPPPVTPWAGVPPTPAEQVDPDKRPGIVTGVAAALLALATMELNGFMPSRHEEMIRILESVRMAGRIDSILAIILFVIAGISLLRMRPHARVWGIRIILLRFLGVVCVSTYFLLNWKNAANPMPINIVLLIGFVAALVGSVAITTVLIILLTRPVVVEAFKRRGE